MTAAAIISLRVNVSPQRAFEAFTNDIGTWWQPHALFQLTPRGDGTLHFIPGEDGRLIAKLANGKEFEVGRIITWQPGKKLTLTWRQASFAPDQSTMLTVLFEPVASGTRITVEHRGWETIPQDHVARHGFALMLFQQRQAEQWHNGLRALQATLPDVSS